MNQRSRKNLYLHILSNPKDNIRNIEEIPDYKFYTQLWVNMRKLSFALGLPLQKYSLEIKKGLLKDGHFESRCQSEIKGGIVNQIIVSFISWGFIYSSINIANLRFEYRDLCFLLICHISGLFFYIFLTNMAKKYKFQNFSTLFSFCYNLCAQLEMGCDGVQVFKTLDFNNISEIQSKDFQILVENIHLLIKDNVRFGHNIIDDIKLVIEDLWDLQEFYYLEFLKTLGVCRIFILLIFYLIPYFYMLYCMINSLAIAVNFT